MKDKRKSILDKVITQQDIPEMLLAVELTKQAGKIGFDWPHIKHVFDKMHEELDELQNAMQNGDPNEILDETGDILFVACNLARHLNIDPGEALRHANQKFIERFQQVENLAYKKFPGRDSFDLALLDNLWDEVKKQNK